MRGLGICSDFLTGSLPESIGQLDKLESLEIYCKSMNGDLPESIGQLGNLTTIYLNGSGFSGAIPSSLGNCKKLSFIDFSGCNFTSFPASLSFFLDDKEHCCLSDIVGRFIIRNNRMSGKIPDSILNHPNFYLFAANFLMAQQSGYGFNLDDFKYPACKDTYHDCFSNQSIDFAKEYAENEYTLIFRYNDSSNTEESALFAKTVDLLNKKYSTKGLKVICGLVNSEDKSTSQLKEYAKALKLSDFPHIKDNLGYGYTPTPFFNDHFWCTRTVPTLGIVDREGNYVIMAGGVTMWEYDMSYLKDHVVTIEQFEERVDNLFKN